MSLNDVIKNSEAIILIEARGFIFGSAISLKARKSMLVARKSGKLSGEIFQENNDLEYGSNSLSIEKEALERFSSYAIVDILLATGGTFDCVSRLINESGKKISGLLTYVELIELNGDKDIIFLWNQYFQSNNLGV